MMIKEDLDFLVKGVTEALLVKELQKKQKTISEYFKEGLFRFILPGIIVFIATFFALQRNFQIFKLNTNNRFIIVEKDVSLNSIQIEKQDKSFKELVEKFYSIPRGTSKGKGTSK